MKKYTQMVISLITLSIVLLVGMNLLLSYFKELNYSNEYNIEMNRIKKAIEAYETEYGVYPESAAKLMQYSGEAYSYITDILCIPTSYSGYFSSENIRKLCSEDNEHFILFQTNLAIYKITYHLSYQFQFSELLIGFNIIIITYIALLAAVLLYLRQKVMKPFHALSHLPYELSKGNLTLPLKESKNRYFGNFLWGMDMLREKLEIEKEREFQLIKEKKLLLISISHDIKTPLSAIKLYAKALDKNLYHDEEKKHKVAESISSHVDEIEKYISEIVLASSEDFMQFEVQMSEVYVKLLIDEIQAYYREKLQLAQISLEIKLYDNCLIKGDADRIIEVIQNIIENALKYGDGILIRIEAKRKEEEYIICIVNTGCTLMENELTHIFDSFFRGTNIKGKSGSGLGLYICRNLMHLMEGEILADVIVENGVQCMCVKLVFRLV